MFILNGSVSGSLYAFLLKLLMFLDIFLVMLKSTSEKISVYACVGCMCCLCMCICVCCMCCMSNCCMRVCVVYVVLCVLYVCVCCMCMCSINCCVVYALCTYIETGQYYNLNFLAKMTCNFLIKFKELEKLRTPYSLRTHRLAYSSFDFPSL